MTADVIIRHDKSRRDAGNQKVHKSFFLLKSWKTIFIIFTQKIQPPFNANKSSRYVELVMVVDKDVFLQLDCNVTLVHETCKKIASYVNAVNHWSHESCLIFKVSIRRSLNRWIFSWCLSMLWFGKTRICSTSLATLTIHLWSSLITAKTICPKIIQTTMQFFFSEQSLKKVPAR